MPSSSNKIYVLLICCSLAFSAVAQPAVDTVRHARVEKSIWRVQIGTIGAWLSYERKLHDLVALRVEVGGVAQLYISEQLYDPKVVGSGWLSRWGPVIRLSPRWYYNLAKRMRQSKDIAGNSGNFVSLPVTYMFALGTHYNTSTRKSQRVDAITIVPSWGIQRNIISHFTFEASVGLAVVIPVLLGGDDPQLSTKLRPEMNFRIGYRFYNKKHEKQKNSY